MRIPRILSACLFFAALASLSCTEAKRFWEEKADTKPKSAGLKTSPSVASNSGSPAASVQSGTKLTANAAVFKGDIAGKAGKEKLYKLLEENDKKIVRLDLLLSDEQLSEINDVDKGKRWYFDLAYPDKDGFNTGGELLIDISKGKGGLHLEGNHLTGQIKISGLAGPHQGLMNINAKPVIETVDAKSVTSDKAAPNAKPSAATRPRSAM